MINMESPNIGGYVKLAGKNSYLPKRQNKIVQTRIWEMEYQAPMMSEAKKMTKMIKKMKKMMMMKRRKKEWIC